MNDAINSGQNALKEIPLKEIRKFQMDMLIDIHNFCKENNIRYSLAGGTLLGAVRHKGYIPWDDDIDIMLPRPDYARFISSYKPKNENFKLDCFEKNKNYSYCFAKVYDTKSIVKEFCFKNDNGIFIDVFPTDGVADNYKNIVWILERLKNLLYLKNRYRSKKDSKSFIIKKNISRLFTNSFLQRLINYIATLSSFEKSNYAGGLLGAYAEKEVHKKEVFLNYSEIEFEGLYFDCISNYDEYLSQHYGNYMELPPKDKQCTHHSAKFYYKEGFEPKES